MKVKQQTKQKTTRKTLQKKRKPGSWKTREDDIRLDCNVNK